MNFDGQKEARQFDQIQNQYDSMSHSVVVIYLMIKIKESTGSFKTKRRKYVFALFYKQPEFNHTNLFLPVKNTLLK